MRRPKFLSSHQTQSQRPAAGDSVILILAFVAILMSGLVGMLILLPWPVVLPAFSLWSLAAAAFVALVACLRPRADEARNVTTWDFVGAFTLIGCAAAVLGEIEYMVEYFRTASLRSEAHD